NPSFVSGPQLLLNANLLNSVADTITITLSATGYAASGPLTLLSPIAGITSGRVSFQEYVDLGNTPFGTSRTPGLQGPYSGVISDSRQLPLGSPSAPFSITKVATIVNVGSAQSSNFEALGRVEPGTGRGGDLRNPLLPPAALPARDV